jgi:hypothetical protein
LWGTDPEQPQNIRDKQNKLGLPSRTKPFRQTGSQWIVRRKPAGWTKLVVKVATNTTKNSGFSAMFCSSFVQNIAVEMDGSLLYLGEVVSDGCGIKGYIKTQVLGSTSHRKFGYGTTTLERRTHMQD